MRLTFSSGLLALALFCPSELWAAPAPSPMLTPETAPVLPLGFSEWESEAWREPTPPSGLLTLHGYLRMRGDLLRNIDFGNRSTVFRAEAGIRDNRSADFTSANMRLRLRPTLNVLGSGPRLSVHATLDVLDNLELGSTPNTLPPAQGGVSNNHNLLARTQNPPSRGKNSIQDSVTLRHAYGQVAVADQRVVLRVGRQPNSFGLGMLANAGDCQDCDFGDAVDRVAVDMHAQGLVLSASLDWVSEGPLSAPFCRNAGQVRDAFDWDDVMQYGLRLEHSEDNAAVADATAVGEAVWLWGVWLLGRQQDRDLTGAGLQSPLLLQANGDGMLTEPASQRRNAYLFTLDGYARFYWQRLKVGLEAALVLGELRDVGEVWVSGGHGPLSLSRTLGILTWGFALEVAYALPPEWGGFGLFLNAGMASGDGHESPSVRQDFAMNPNYHIDRLLFRTILRGISDATYVTLGATYDFDENIALRGQAGFAARGTEPLGTELNAEVGYTLAKTPDGHTLQGHLSTALVFPFGAFDRAGHGTSVAWAIMARLFCGF
jgi:uncharacterized protein (TIGR04551 family)